MKSILRASAVAVDAAGVSLTSVPSAMAETWCSLSMVDSSNTSSKAIVKGHASIFVPKRLRSIRERPA